MENVCFPLFNTEGNTQFQSHFLIFVKPRWTDLCEVILLQSYVRLTSMRQLIFSSFLMKPVRQLSVESPLPHGEPLALFMTGNIRRLISSQHLHNAASQGGRPRAGAGQRLFFFPPAYYHLLMDSKSPPSLVCRGLLCQGTDTHKGPVRPLLSLVSVVIKSSRWQRQEMVWRTWKKLGLGFPPPWPGHITRSGQ